MLMEMQWAGGSSCSEGCEMMGALAGLSGWELIRGVGSILQADGKSNPETTGCQEVVNRIKQLCIRKR